MGMFDCWNKILENQPAWLEVSLDPKAYEQAERIYRSLGYTPEDAVRLLIHHLVARSNSIQQQLSQGVEPHALLLDAVAATNAEIIRCSAAHAGYLTMRDNIDTPFNSAFLNIKEQTFSATTLRKRQRCVFDYIEVLGNVAIITRKGVRECAMMSIATYKQMICCAESFAAPNTQFANGNHE